MTKRSHWRSRLVSAFLFAVLLAGCTKPKPPRSEFSMGELVPVGQITYTVVETAWKTQLGESLGFQSRTPENRFLVIKMSVTNGTGKDISIPLLTLEGSKNQTYRELANGQGVDNWFGVLRTITPGQTQQGNILFDVPLSSYKLQLPDVGDSGFEGYAVVQIPLQINPDLPLDSPIDPNALK